MHDVRKFRLARQWSNRILREICPQVTGDVVNVSAGEDLDKEGSSYAEYFPKASSYSLTNYKANSFRGFQGRSNEHQLDLTSEVPPELRLQFDVVLNHTTLEHVFDVTTAFRNLCSLSRDLVIVVVPFCQQQHEETDYGDFWRFTPSCLRKLYEINEMDVVYEAANNQFNVATYLLFAGARNGEAWRKRLPAWKPIYPAASWVGDSPWKAWNERLSSRFKSIFPFTSKVGDRSIRHEGRAA